MYKICQSEQSAARQRQLEQGLLKAMGKRHYDEITVSDLCEELGIPRKSFYRYFSGKDGALHSLIDHALMDYEQYAAQKLPERGQTPLRYMENVCSYWIHCKPLLDALARSSMSGVLVQRTIVHARELDSLPYFLRTAEKQLQDYGAMFASCGIMTMIVQWHHDGYSQSVEQMARLMVHLLSKPLFNVETME